MKYFVKKNKKNVGSLIVSNETVSFMDCNEDFKVFVESSIEKGITRFEDKQLDEKRVLFEVPVKRNDPLFELALAEWIKRQGYEVTTLHPEVDEEIINTLPQLTYREKTFLLKHIRQFKKDHKEAK